MSFEKIAEEKNFKETLMSSKQTKVCKTCKRNKRLNQFGGHVHMEDGKQDHCLDCMGDKVRRGKNAGKNTSTSELEFLSAEGNIERELNDKIQELHNIKKRLRSGMFESFKFVNGKLVVTI